VAYAHGHHESVLRSHAARTVADSAAYLVSSLFSGARVLDVGAGPGTITVDLADRVFPGRVIGMDAAPDVVEIARAAIGGRANVEFRVGDAYALDLPDASFDIVHAHQTLQHLARPVDALRELRRVAGPDGLVAARDVDYGGVIWHPRIPALDEWIVLYEAVHRGVSGEPDAGRVLKAWAREAGFMRIDASASVWVFDTPEKRAWWGGMWPTGSWHPLSPDTPAGSASPMTRRCSGSRRRGGSGRTTPTGGSCSRTARSSRAADLVAARLHHQATGAPFRSRNRNPGVPR
jgi:SAM-dependent methyltransferase